MVERPVGYWLAFAKAYREKLVYREPHHYYGYLRQSHTREQIREAVSSMPTGS